MSASPEDGGRPPINAKILVLGGDGAGKTSLIEALNFTAAPDESSRRNHPLKPETEVMLSTPAFTISKKVMDITRDMVVGDKEEKTEDYVWIQDIPSRVELRFWEPVNREHKEETGAKKWAKVSQRREERRAQS